MATLLLIETATPLCSVALSRNGAVIASRETLEEKSHASRLTVFIEEMLRETGHRMQDLDAVAVGKGPGSYTGLRIGVSTAKGICFGANLPLVAIGTLEVLYRQARIDMAAGRQPVHDALFCPMIDARRMEVFTCLYTSDGHEAAPASAHIVDGDSFRSELAEREIWFFGSGMEKCRGVLTHPHARFLKDIHPHAAALAQAAAIHFDRKQFENIAYFEPFYLKDFVATVSKKGLSDFQKINHD
jgi:tRNA threonylcarbamoyladenosine biosynthesis protein TsaB